QSPGIGQGATFIVSLPLRVMRTIESDAPDGPDSTANRTLVGDPSRLKGLRILVVDDEADSRELVRRVLVDGEAVTALAASAAEAQAMLATFDPNVIISDIGMPIQDGY